MTVGADGAVARSDIYRARVRNRAKLAYNGVAAWLDGTAAMPAAMAAVDGLAENIRDQDRIAQRLKHLRHVHGALSLETVKARPVFDDGLIRGLDVERKNRATEIIEDFMIAANGATARFLAAKHFPSIRRVVRTPKRWDRIVDSAAHGVDLWQTPWRSSRSSSSSSRRPALPDLSTFKLLSRRYGRTLAAAGRLASRSRTTRIPPRPIAAIRT
jgi:exoribonuclease-2